MTLAVASPMTDEERCRAYRSHHRIEVDSVQTPGSPVEIPVCAVDLIRIYRLRGRDERWRHHDGEVHDLARRFPLAGTVHDPIRLAPPTPLELVDGR
jgi:hypothetical protein